MDVRALILDKMEQKRCVTSSEIVNATGFSRTYVNRFFQQLRDEGKIALVGKANRAHYVRATREAEAKAKLLSISLHLKNENLVEDETFDKVRNETGIIAGAPENVSNIIQYAFTEMLNNAIEHSRSQEINVTMKQEEDLITFSVIDSGVGIFNNIMKKKHLRSEIEAIQDLLKGKLTTAPEAHSGEGIFFTSRVADRLILQSSNKRLIFDNLIKDVFVKDAKRRRGTKVFFAVSLNSRTDLSDVFRQYTDESYEFSKTHVAVKLFKMRADYVSRSQARRILVGLDKFKTVILDFGGIDTIGQAFADEVFRVWPRQHPMMRIVPQNTNENIDFMIRRAKSTK